MRRAEIARGSVGVRSEAGGVVRLGDELRDPEIEQVGPPGGVDQNVAGLEVAMDDEVACLLYTSPSPRD